MSFQTKKDVSIEDLKGMHPFILLIFAEFYLYCYENKIPCVLTSLMENAPGRISETHSDGRAFDASVRGWSDFHIHRIVYHFNEKFKDIAAISASDNKPRAVVYHKVEGGAHHLHFQCRKDKE